VYQERTDFIQVKLQIIDSSNAESPKEPQFKQKLQPNRKKTTHTLQDIAKPRTSQSIWIIKRNLRTGVFLLDFVFGFIVILLCDFFLANLN